MTGTDPVLVVGGTRGTGLLIARLLLQRGYLVRVLARDPNRAAPQAAPTVDVVAGDLTRPGTLTPAVRGAGHIVFTAGDHSGQGPPRGLGRTLWPVEARRIGTVAHLAQCCPRLKAADRVGSVGS